MGGLRIVEHLEIRNDTEAPLRAGTDGWGVAVVSGTGINALGRAPDGRVARFAGLGLISGDHGGGGAAGILALGAAVGGAGASGAQNVARAVGAGVLSDSIGRCRFRSRLSTDS